MEGEEKGGDAGMRIKYVGNAGVIIETDETCIGIDCFCRDEFEIYPDLSIEDKESLFEMIETGKLKLLIFTHEHSDHFYAGDVKAACEKNSDLKVLAGQKVIELLYKERIPPKQLITIEPPRSISEGRLEITFIKTEHDGDQYADVENLTLLINIGTNTIVVTGDAKPSEALFTKISDWSKKVDLFIAPFPYVGLQTARKQMVKHLDVREIVATHEPRPEKDTMGWLKSTEKVCTQANEGLPTPIFSKKKKEWHCL